MANKLAEGAVARVEKIGGLLEKVVGKVIGSGRLQERGQEHIEHARTVRGGDEQADAPNAEPEGGEVVELQPQAEADEETEADAPTSATPQDGQVVGVWDPDKQHQRRRYGL